LDCFGEEELHLRHWFISPFRPTAQPSLTLSVPSIQAFIAPAAWRTLVLGTAYGLIDGAVGGFIFASLYNLFAGRSSASVQQI
jgi:hypothetical protein